MIYWLLSRYFNGWDIGWWGCGLSSEQLTSTNSFIRDQSVTVLGYLAGMLGCSMCFDTLIGRWCCECGMCWNKVVCTEGLLMEGSGSVLGFHSSYLASQRNLRFWGQWVNLWLFILGVVQWKCWLSVQSIWWGVWGETPFLVFPNEGYVLRAFSFGGTVTVRVSLQGGFFFSPLVPYFTYFLEKTLEIDDAQRSCVHDGWESSGLSPGILARDPCS